MNYDEDFAREVLLDHSGSPRNKGTPNHFSHYAKVAHDVKDENIEVFLQLTGDNIDSASFEGEGSAVAIASASMMTTYINGRSTVEALALREQLISMLTSHDEEPLPFETAPELISLAGIRQYPARVACASLAWNALKKALSEDATET